MAVGGTEAPIPGEVLDAFHRVAGFDSPPDSWTFESLSPNNPVFRIASAEERRILKRSHDSHRVLLVADLFAAWSVPSFSVKDLGGGWLVLGDLGLPTLGEWIGGRSVDPPLAFQLGVVAAQSDRVGMRDRKPANILVDARGVAAGPRLVPIDYEGAFCAGLFDRMVRPRLYLAYLIKRLLLRVLEASGARLERELETGILLERFAEGFRSEAERLDAASRRLPGTTRPKSLRQRLTLMTPVGPRHRHAEEFSRAFRVALRSATSKEHA